MTNGAAVSGAAAAGICHSGRGVSNKENSEENTI